VEEHEMTPSTCDMVGLINGLDNTGRASVLTLLLTHLIKVASITDHELQTYPPAVRETLIQRRRNAQAVIALAGQFAWQLQA
jgi:hypothetical protein